MEHDIVDKHPTGLEEWYAEYVTQENPITAQNSEYSEPLDLDAIEAQTVDLMEEIDVTDGFCSTCHTMLDNWPDIQEMERKTVRNNGPVITLQSSLIDLNPGDWIKNSGRDSMWNSDSDSTENSDDDSTENRDEEWTEDRDQLAYVLPCQEQTKRFDAATRKGCRCCGLILQTLKDKHWLPIYRTIEKRLHRLGRTSSISLVVYGDGSPEHTLELGFPGRLFRECHQFLPIRLRIFECGGIYEKPPSWQVPVSQSSPMMLAQQWIIRCLQSHKKCDVKKPPSYPTRLLSIGSDPIQLVITTTWSDRSPYATLSHCWGKTKFETLATANLDELQRGVPSRFLSKTFADAIQIARASGLGYLWIDSLCIIQDDEKDWEVEANMMASVYGGSTLNIAASSARDGTEGCFLKPQHHGGGFRARIRNPGGRGIYEFTPGNEYEKCVTQSHLATRAWTVQEKVLPPRTLHCGNQGLFWECRSHMASEYLPDGFCDGGPFPRMARESILCDYDGLTIRADEKHWKLVKGWYSGCNLTKPEDKLVALSGIARSIQDRTGDEYLAGVWRKTLDEELCWRATDPRKRPSRPSKPSDRAPSWSWAAIDGQIVSKTIRPGILAEKLAHVNWGSVIPSGENMLGAVSHGTLSLKCDVIVSGIIVAEDLARAKRKLYTKRHRINPDQEKGVCFSTLGQEGHVFPFLLDCNEDKDRRYGQTVHYLPLRRGGNEFLEDSNGPFPDDERVFGLVLEELDGIVTQYKRIGCFEYCASTFKLWAEGDDDNKCSFPEDYAHFQKLCDSLYNSEGQDLHIV